LTGESLVRVEGGIKKEKGGGGSGSASGTPDCGIKANMNLDRTKEKRGEGPGQISGRGGEGGLFGNTPGTTEKGEELGSKGL